MNDKLSGMLELFASTLANDETVTEYRKAREDYFADDEFVKTIGEYNAIKTAYEHEVANSDDETEAKERLDARVHELYEKITSDERHIRLSRVEDELNTLLTEINQTLMAAVTGQSASGCSGDCSGCKGCH